MGFWNDMGEGLFGTESSKKSKKNTQRAIDVGSQTAWEGQTLKRTADEALDRSMGGSAATMLGKAQAASTSLADAFAKRDADENAKAQIKAARTAGMAPGLAAILAGQGAGSAYNQSFNQGMNANMDRYNQNVGLFQNRQQAAANQALQGANVMQGGAAQQMNNANTTFQNTAGGIGKIAGAVSGGLA